MLPSAMTIHSSKKDDFYDIICRSKDAMLVSHGKINKFWQTQEQKYFGL